MSGLREKKYLKNNLAILDYTNYLGGKENESKNANTIFSDFHRVLIEIEYSQSDTIMFFFTEGHKVISFILYCTNKM